MHHEEKDEMLTFEKLEPLNVGHFSKMTQIIKMVEALISITVTIP